jgi:thymidylate synthase ThyX
MTKTQYDENIGAELVWDGGPTIRVPKRLGEPRHDQLVGSVRESLGELAGRACYDSLGQGRPSWDQYSDSNTGAGPSMNQKREGYHRHILATANTSVYEHCVFTLEFMSVLPRDLAWLANRPNLWYDRDLYLASSRLRVTMNVRHALEWCGKGPPPRETKDSFALEAMGSLSQISPKLASLVFNEPNYPPLEGHPTSYAAMLREPTRDEEKWVTLFMHGSRGFSHEQVRHGDWTAISQRSTRYVDESESPWVEHPLISEWLADRQATDEHVVWEFEGLRGPDYDDGVLVKSRILYDFLVNHLQAWLISRGVDKQTARKQARGAARGYLGNALYTEVVFSASIAQWKWMLRQRLSAPADGEIRVCYAPVLRALKGSRYGECFAGWETRPSPDGIGEVLHVDA